MKKKKKKGIREERGLDLVLKPILYEHVAIIRHAAISYRTQCLGHWI